MKKIAFPIFLLLLCSYTWAQDVTDAPSYFPEIVYPSLDGAELSSKAIFSKSELSIVVFWAQDGFCMRQMKGIEKAYAEWKEKYEVQIVIVGVGKDLEGAKRSVERYRGKLNSTILLDKYIIERGQVTVMERSASVPGITKLAPSTLFVTREEKIVASFLGFKPQTQLDQAITDFFAKE